MSTPRNVDLAERPTSDSFSPGGIRRPGETPVFIAANRFFNSLLGSNPMLSVHLTPEAKVAIVKQFALLGLSDPALFIYRDSGSADITRSSSGQVKWNIERPETLLLRFGELPTSVGDPEHFLLVDGIRMCVGIVGGRPRDADVEISVRNGELFIDTLNVDLHIETAESHNLAVGKAPSKGIPLGLLPHGETLGPSGIDRLRLHYIAIGNGGLDFHSLQWDSYIAGEWQRKLSLTREQFQGEHQYRRWVSDLHDFRPESGIAVIQVGEGNRPLTTISSTTFLYSWRAWDLVRNVEVERLKDCDGPFEPPE